MILIDYNAIAIANVLSHQGDIEEDLIRHMILNSIRMFRAKYYREYGEVIVCCDGRNNWRKHAFPQYKHQRRVAREESKLDWENLFGIVEQVKQELKSYFPYKVIDIPDCEADDIIAQIAMNTQEFGNYEPVMIISGDHDFVQLQVMDNVKQFSPVQKKMVKNDDPSQYLLDHILRGDRGDGIPNVLSDDDCLVRGDRQRPMTSGKVRQILSGELKTEEIDKHIKRNTRLIDLTMTPEPIIQEIINNFNDEDLDCRGNKSHVMNYLITNKCRLLLESIGDFVND